jgi:hypothetical protein
MGPIARRVLTAAALAVIGATCAQADVAKMNAFGDWSLYIDDKKPHQFCFVASEPKSSEPPDTAREPAHIYISAWPKDGVKTEVSVLLGFPPKKNTEVTASVAPAGFKMFANDDRAFVQDPTQELKLVDAMKKGSKLSVSATTQTGVAVTDSYSLSGLGQAMSELQSSCF